MSIVQFYRRKLPDVCISFSSDEGKEVFKEALSEGTMNCYFSLAAQFRTQDEPAFCGLSTLVMVLNALSVDPGRVWKGPWRWYHENMLECCIPVKIVEEKGITLKQFSCIASCNSLNAKVTQVNADSSIDTFRSLIEEISQNNSQFMTCSYSRRVLKQTGDGHFAPIGGYHKDRDIVLILDTARFKYPPHWIPLQLLWNAMCVPDSDTGEPRGYCLLSRSVDTFPMMLFKISDSLAINQKKSRGISLLEDWRKWLRENVIVENTGNTKIIVQTVVHQLLNSLRTLHSGDVILTVQNTEVGELSCDYVCHTNKLVEALSNTELYLFLCGHCYNKMGKTWCRKSGAKKTEDNSGRKMSSESQTIHVIDNTQREAMATQLPSHTVQLSDCKADIVHATEISSSEKTCLPDRTQEEMIDFTSKGFGDSILKSNSPLKCINSLTPVHFITVFLLAWPYDEPSDTRTNVLQVSYNDFVHTFTQQQVDSGADILKNEVKQLRKRLHDVLNYFC